MISGRTIGSVATIAVAKRDEVSHNDIAAGE